MLKLFKSSFNFLFIFILLSQNILILKLFNVYTLLNIFYNENWFVSVRVFSLNKNNAKLYSKNLGFNFFNKNNIKFKKKKLELFLKINNNSFI